MKVVIAWYCLILCQVYSTLSQSTSTKTKITSTTNTHTSTVKTTSTGPSSTTLTPEEATVVVGTGTGTTNVCVWDKCSSHNKSCGDCITNVKCFYCYGEVNSCKPYPQGNWMPWSLKCPLADARWAVCWLNFEAMLISVGVVGGVIILTITCLCIYCCCCRGGNKAKYIKDEIKMEQEKSERKQRSADKRADRQERLNEIRRKYGLVKDEPSYERFEA